MHLKDGSTQKTSTTKRRLSIRIAITSLLISGAAMVSTVAPASAFFPPPDTGYSLSNYVSMDYSTGHGVY